MKSKKDIGALDACQLCSQKDLKRVLSLGHQPIVQQYLKADELKNPESTYPLNICFCSRCGLLQLDHIIDPEIVFPRNYPYRTGLTNMLIRNFRELADTIEKRYRLRSGDLVVDIGSNDGTLLAGFKAKGMRVLGVEPTDAADTARSNGIPTLQEFFNKKTVKKIIAKYGRAKLVTAANVFAHITDAPGLSRNIANLLDTGGIFVSESQYFLDTVQKLEFDCVYHEHLRFYTLKPLKKLLSRANLTLVDAEHVSAAGGSIRAYAVKGTAKRSPHIAQLISAEKKAGLYELTVLRNFAAQAVSAKHDLLALLIRCKKKGRIVGIGSPARSNTLLNFTHIDNHLLDYACEKADSPKIGLFTPGGHIPIVDERRLIDEQPEYALLLSWHIGEELMPILRKKGYRGAFIMPLPAPRIIR